MKELVGEFYNMSDFRYNNELVFDYFIQLIQIIRRKHYLKKIIS